jgi:nitrous oxidase accessory protein NosD
MSTTPRDVLVELVAQHGEPLLTMPLRMDGFLKDYCGEFRREIFVLISCLRVGIVDQLRRPTGPSIKLSCARLALKLEQNLAISGDVARWGVESWAIALGLLEPTAATPSAPGLFDHSVRSPRPDAEPDAPGGLVAPREEAPPAAPPSEPVEYLARPPEPRWQVGDWSSPSVTIEVFPDGSGQKPGLRDAVRDAPPDACLVLKPGLYRESLVIKKPLQIRGEAGAHETTLESQTACALQVDGGCVFVAGLLIRGLGGREKKVQPAIDVKSGHMVIEDCDVSSDCSTVIEVKGPQSEAYLRRCHLHDGKAGGILFQDDAAGYLEGCHLYQNKLSQIVIGKGSSPVVMGCKISHALMAGIYVSDGGEGLIEDCDIWGNAVGGVQARRGGNPHLRYCRISANERCGVLVTEQGEGFFEHCQIFDNSVVGVAISSGSLPRLSACQIFDNHGPGIEAIEHSHGDVLDCEVFSNEGANVVLRDGSDTQLHRCVIHDGRREGALVTAARGVFEECAFHGNALSGILLLEGASPELRKCVLHHGGGGGVEVGSKAQGHFVDCEVAQHSATAVMVRDDAEPHFERCHIIDNRGVGVHADAGSAPLLQECVIAHNGGTGFLCTQASSPRMIEGEITGNNGGLLVSAQGNGRWEQVHFTANHGESVLVAEGGKPELRLCRIENAQDIGVHFMPSAQGVLEEVEISGSSGTGIEVAENAAPLLRLVHVLDGRGAGILVRAQGGGTADKCEVARNAGGDWVVTDGSRLVQS